MHCYITVCLYVALLGTSTCAYSTLAGGRPNAFSEGQNAFAGVVNPANAVWIKDRFDMGAYWLHQIANLKNIDGSPSFSTGTIDTTYKAKNSLMGDMAIQKCLKVRLGDYSYDLSTTLATYTTPSLTKIRMQYPLPNIGSTPIQVYNQVRVFSLVLSLKTSSQHSFGISLDLFQCTHKRNGFQKADNLLRSVSPGHVTNNGYDHSKGVGLTIGWRWNITESFCFGMAWVKKSYLGQYRKYRGYEPQHARNYFPQTIGAGFRYRFSSKLAGRLEVVWSNFGNTPQANDNFLAHGAPNIHRRGSKHSPGPGLQDATFVNCGLGYKWNEIFSTGLGFSHRIKLAHKNPSFLSHTYTHGTIYELLSLGANFKHQKHDLFFSLAYGFKNSVTGTLPKATGGGRMTANKRICTCSFSWGFLY